jgi:hypothetical protein
MSVIEFSARTRPRSFAPIARAELVDERLALKSTADSPNEFHARTADSEVKDARVGGVYEIEAHHFHDAHRFREPRLAVDQHEFPNRPFAVNVGSERRNGAMAPSSMRRS